MGKPLLLVLVLVCAACANNVPQDRSTGPDGTITGAKELAVAEDEGVGAARDIVTYPGGDRVDWKKIVLPANARGTLDIQLTYTTPRPNLKVAIDVFDQLRKPVDPKTVGRGRTKEVSISGASGTYFVRVYAPRRGDAGTYRLTATFEKDPPPPPPVTVAEPPRLPPVPDPDPTTCPAWDPVNPICATTCPPGAPANHKPCQAATPPPVTTAPVPPAPPVAPARPVIARIMKSELQPDGTIIVILGAGSEHGIGKEWTKGSLLQKGTLKDAKAKFPNGGVTVIQVDRRTTKVRLRQGITSDVLRDNDTVVLEP